MKKLIFLGILFSFFVSATVAGQKNFHSFTVVANDGSQFDLSQLKGKKVLVVNVASKCGLTPQYSDLQALYEKYKDDNFVIIAFPANNFLGQEPGTNEEIIEFCRQNYGVTFPVMAKISVKGKDIAPVYRWLTEKSENGLKDAEVSWNFQKFLIDEDGNWVNMLSPKTSPTDNQLINWIEGKQ
ncbi:MAG: glutathione peroxidase [Prevotellaceae bacterium]|jgi:glutathione peroxidase|nr:glutathione peroxidase [Prevotellaceae bacterium]